jgi:hypothetical protein
MHPPRAGQFSRGQHPRRVPLPSCAESPTRQFVRSSWTWRPCLVRAARPQRWRMNGRRSERRGATRIRSPTVAWAWTRTSGPAIAFRPAWPEHRRPLPLSRPRRPSQEGEEDDGDDDKVARPTSAVASFIRPYLAADISSAHRFPPPFLPCSYPPLVASMANSSGFFPRFSSQESIKKIENCLPGTAKQVPCELLHRPRRHGPEVSMARRCAAKS